MRKFLPFFIIIFSILGGIGWGILLLFQLPNLPLKPNHSLYKSFGIRKPQIIGFAPYWLFDKAADNYKELSTFTYFGLTLDSDGTIVKLLNPQEEEPGWTFLRSDKLKNKLIQYQKNQVKNSLLVHLSNESSISALLKQPQVNAQNLVDEISPIMREYGFSDLNLDIESFINATDSAKAAFSQFVNETAFNLKRKNPQMTLTLELPVRALFKPTIYDPVKLGETADNVVLMAYDFHYSGSFTSGPVAPLFGATEIWEMDVASSMTQTLNMIPKEKLILGIPLYGYEWETLSPHKFAATIPNSYSTASNKRVSELLKTCPACNYYFDKISQSPVVLIQDQQTAVYRQIYYEDKNSLNAKLNLAKTMEISGVAFWALGYEGEDMFEPLANYQNLAFW